LTELILSCIKSVVGIQKQRTFLQPLPR